MRRQPVRRRRPAVARRRTGAAATPGRRESPVFTPGARVITRRAAQASANPWRVLPGRPWPLGATWDGGGVNFALFSAHAVAVELCLFDGDGKHALGRLGLQECTDDIWHAYLPDARPGQVYAYRVHGPYEPGQGHRFNHHKLLLDPYARAYTGTFHWTDAHCGYRVGDAREDLSFDRRDNAWAMPRARVVDARHDLRDERRPHTPWDETVICEAHIKGYTMLNPDVPAHLRGTYAGFAHPASIARLKAAGATAVELLPVQESVDERALAANGLVNYWGYNPLGYFAPAARYALGREPATEFRAMVRALHAAGLEVILDVVYNHTAEGNERGPTLSWRGIDNASYYRLAVGTPRRYDDLSGCGNTLDLTHPRVLQMVMDSLRFWVDDMHVDGFRFDLATALARGPAGFDARAGFLDALRQDPALARVKLIAEPWDTATWKTGQFPAGLAEWNDRYRDCVRAFWLTGGAGRGELARRIAGSSDLFRHGGRRPQASINFVTAHDGFSLADLTSYSHKHNEANGQDNRDGADHDHSINCGVEGPSADPVVLARRARLSRAMLATLFVSQGVPMLPAGDDQGRTQSGNNNAYCQDNPVTWLNWDGADRDLRAYVAALARLRRAHPALRRRCWFDGSPTALGERDITWIAPAGAEMTQADWDDGGRRAFGFVPGRLTQGEVALAVLINAEAGAVEFRLAAAPGGAWHMLLDSSREARLEAGVAHVPGESVLLLASAPPPAPHTIDE